MKKYFILTIMLLSAVSLAHLGEEVEEHEIKEMPVEDCSTESCFIEESFSYNLLAAEFGLALLIALAMISIAAGKKLKAIHRKILFVLMAGVIIIITSFMIFTTIYSNYFSYSGGPVHWHADYEIWICGERMALEESEGLENKVGTPVFHHHNDNRIHVEGVVMKIEDISLGRFFETIGGHFDSESLKINLIDGSAREFKYGDLCYSDGIPMGIAMYVNGKANYDFDKFILAPYGTVPPGDFINITNFPLPPTATVSEGDENSSDNSEIIRKFPSTTGGIYGG